MCKKAQEDLRKTEKGSRKKWKVDPKNDEDAGTPPVLQAIAEVVINSNEEQLSSHINNSADLEASYRSPPKNHILSDPCRYPDQHPDQSSASSYSSEDFMKVHLRWARIQFQSSAFDYLDWVRVHSESTIILLIAKNAPSQRFHNYENRVIIFKIFGCIFSNIIGIISLSLHQRTPKKKGISRNQIKSPCPSVKKHEPRRTAHFATSSKDLKSPNCQLSGNSPLLSPISILSWGNIKMTHFIRSIRI